MAALRELDLDRNTLVVFTSDNGPWAVYDKQGGSAGMLRGAKGGTFEGGMRVPAIFWWPGVIRSAVVADIGSTLDLLPTLAALSAANLPKDHDLDGHDLGPVLRGRAPAPARRWSITAAQRCSRCGMARSRRSSSREPSTAPTA